MNNLRTFIARLHLKDNGRFLGFGTSPEADWKIIFFLTAFLALLVVILSILLFFKIGSEDIFAMEKPPEQTKKVLNIAVLKDTTLYYQGKALEFERIKNTAVPPAVDPSI